MNKFRTGERNLLKTLTLAFLMFFVTPVSGGMAEEDRAGEAVYLVQLEGAPLATYKGTVAGLGATSPATAGLRRLDVRSAAVKAYAARLGQKRAYAASDMESVLGHPLETVHQYDTALNGLAVRMTAAEAAKVAGMPGVVRIERDRVFRIQETGIPASLLMTADTDGSWPLGFMPPMTIFFPPSLLLLASLWGVIRRRRRAWRWMALSASLLVVTAACGGSSDDSTAKSLQEFEPSPGAAWIGAPGVWSGSETGGLPATKGEGVVVGVLDTGINPHSPSFAAAGGDGYVHSNPRGKFFGVCDPENWEIYNPNFPCNDKLIGAWSFVSDDFNHTVGNPVDFHGHGTHVAATAAGNVVQDAVIHTPSGLNLSRGISGAAPHAHLISYRVMGADGTGSFSQVLAGIEQAIRDGVDVINLSLGGGLENPWKDSILGSSLLSAREAGISVAVAAGNYGPDPATLTTPGIIPWVTAVAAGTHDTVYVNKLSLSGGLSVPAEIEGMGLTAGYGPASVVYAGEYGDPLCRGDFAEEFNGEIVVCDRGEAPLVDKGKVVKEQGGGGMILAEVDPGGVDALVGMVHYLPAVHIAKADSDRLKDWLSRGKDHTAVISGAVPTRKENRADIMASFSSRGWNPKVPDVIKPDVLAPGSAIVAPVVDGIGYSLLQGTSMAAPHVAGIFALLKALHPEWTPAEVQSAVMTTARQGVKENLEGIAATPFAAGAGRIDAGRAARAALVLDETPSGFEEADPASYWESAEAGVGDPADMNLAGLGEDACVGRCSWTRIIRSVADRQLVWTANVETDPGLSLAVEPETFIIAPDERIEITVTADVSGIPQDEWSFGRVVLTDTEGDAPEAGLPVAVRSLTENLPESLTIGSGPESGFRQFHRLEAEGISNLSVSVQGLVPAALVQESVESDPTPEDAANLDGGTYTVLVDVPSDAAVLFVDLESSVAPELNLYVGMNDSLEPLAESTRSGSVESVVVPAPSAGPWWIAIHNPASDRMSDPFTLHYGVVSAEDADNGNLTATPDRTDGSPFGITLDWDLPGTAAGDHWYGAVNLGSSAAVSNDIGTIPVKLVLE